MKTIKNLGNLFVLALLFTFYSCREEENMEPVSEQEEVAIADESTSHDALVDVEMQIFEEFVAEDEGGRIAATCVTVTRDADAKTITLDFGDGCVGPYGRERSGKVIITYGGEFGDHLANRVITFHNYFVNNKQITGTIELRDLNLDANGNLTLTRRHVNLKVLFSDGNHFTSNGSITITWIAGYGDADPSNNVFQITGSQEGISTRGRRVTRTITEPVIVDFSCIASGGIGTVDGKIEVHIQGVARERSRVIDYGDGTCDGTITVTVNGKMITITIS